MAGASVSRSHEAGRFASGRLIAYAFGLLLLIAAVWAVASRGGALSHALASARHAHPRLIVLVLLLPLANIAAISASFWVLTSRFGRVSKLEMLALIVSSWLLNHLPLRPGLVGRVGYHRVVNAIPVRASLRVIVEQLVGGVAALAVLLGVAIAFRSLGLAVVVTTLLIAGGVLAAGGLAGRGNSEAGPPRIGACYCAALGFRLLDMTIWIVRYTCLFELVGHPVGVADAAAITAASQAVMLSPIPLGLREWVVGVVHGSLGATWISEGGVAIATFAPGISADLVNRAAELVVAVLLGITASIWLARRVRRATAARGNPDSPHPDIPASV